MGIEPLNVRITPGTEADTAKYDATRGQNSETLQISVPEEMFLPVDGLVTAIADGNKGLIRTALDKTEGPKLCDAIGYLPDDYQNALAKYLREMWDGAEPGSLGEIIKKLYALMGSGAVLALTALIAEMNKKESPPEEKKQRKDGDGDGDGETQVDMYI